MALAMPIMLLADGQVKSKEISSDYARNSVSNILVTYSDSWDAQVREGFGAYGIGDKFDANAIATRFITLPGAVRSVDGRQFGAPNSEAKTAITAYLN